MLRTAAVLLAGALCAGAYLPPRPLGTTAPATETSTWTGTRPWETESATYYDEQTTTTEDPLAYSATYPGPSVATASSPDDEVAPSSLPPEPEVEPPSPAPTPEEVATYSPVPEEEVTVTQYVPTTEEEETDETTAAPAPSTTVPDKVCLSPADLYRVCAEHAERERKREQSKRLWERVRPYLLRYNKLHKRAGFA